ncbi:hypothetical protein HKX48_002179 [Thoreauomyces humboldtii]|nr:hypothetical protein HKX48_002179 [Thoreauomyces humboldtii]
MDRIGRALTREGLDAGPPFSTDQLQDQIPHIPGRPTSTAFLVYSTWRFWDYFLAHLASNPEDSLEREPNPLDVWAEVVIRRALQASLPPGLAYEIRYPHDTGARFVNFQRLASDSGLAYFDPTWQFLCVHPVYGPWFAFRALVVLDPDDLDGMTAAALAIENNPCSSEGVEEARDLDQKLKEDVAVDAAAGVPLADAYRVRWQSLVDIRDCVGRSMGDECQKHRYCDLQIRYHYTQDKDCLRRAIADHVISYSSLS